MVRSSLIADVKQAQGLTRQFSFILGRQIWNSTVMRFAFQVWLRLTQRLYIKALLQRPVKHRVIVDEGGSAVSFHKCDKNL